MSTLIMLLVRLVVEAFRPELQKLVRRLCRR
jgi:hypothetical protein